MGDRALDAARTVRKAARDVAADGLAAALDAEMLALQRRDEAALELGAFRRAEGERLERERARSAMMCTAAELQRLEHYRARRQDEESALRARLALAQREHDEASRDVREARDALGRAEAGSQVLERHHERSQREQQRSSERARDDEADELAASMREFSSRFREP